MCRSKLVKSNKGFSLVELIIVMAIMVALIAVLAPQFIKYIEKARNSVVTDAAYNVLSVAKSEYAVGSLKCIDNTKVGTIEVGMNATRKLDIKLVNLSYNDKTGTDADDAFKIECGIGDNPTQNDSDLVYNITVYGDGFSQPQFNVDQSEHENHFVIESEIQENND